MKYILLILFALTVIILFPLAVIASLNNLFPSLNIAVDFTNWCSVIVLAMFFQGGVTLVKK